MKCNQCNQELEPGAQICPFCGAQQPAAAADVQQPYTGAAQFAAPPTINETPYLIWSILVTVLCCMPLGIAGIVYATKIKSALAAGDFAGAQAAAKQSKLFSIIGGALGGAIVLIYILALVLTGFARAAVYY